MARLNNFQQLRQPFLVSQMVTSNVTCIRFYKFGFLVILLLWLAIEQTRVLLSAVAIIALRSLLLECVPQSNGLRFLHNDGAEQLRWKIHRILHLKLVRASCHWFVIIVNAFTVLDAWLCVRVLALQFVIATLSLNLSLLRNNFSRSLFINDFGKFSFAKILIFWYWMLLSRPDKNIFDCRIILFSNFNLQARNISNFISSGSVSCVIG
jgi:hypothetical protein